MILYLTHGNGEESIPLELPAASSQVEEIDIRLDDICSGEGNFRILDVKSSVKGLWQFMVKHPVIYKLLRYAACFVLAAALASGTWLTANAEARTAFFAWMREQYEAFVEYRFTGEASQENESADYELTWLPEGFSLQKEQNLDGGTYLTYTDDSGQRIIFSCLKGDDAASLFVTSDYTEVQSTQVGDICADFYQADGEASSICLSGHQQKMISFFILWQTFPSLL